ncbi:hypothetical protein C2G38_2044508 [Gigaspora rosea]|uniref:Uncharacterized protein n=1 Tax=Gigaspora rosea TaxID=44941 RepID=A0A397UI68_9GLOM|nr:hypothetical protein C2G38_2044508 [Gigaspora rosea]
MSYQKRQNANCTIKFVVKLVIISSFLENTCIRVKKLRLKLEFMLELERTPETSLSLLVSGNVVEDRNEDEQTSDHIVKKKQRCVSHVITEFEDKEMKKYL